MTEPTAEPDVETPDEPGSNRPKAPDLPDPAFPEALPGGEEGPGETGGVNLDHPRPRRAPTGQACWSGARLPR